MRITLGALKNKAAQAPSLNPLNQDSEYGDWVSYLFTVLQVIFAKSWPYFSAKVQIFMTYFYFFFCLVLIGVMDPREPSKPYFHWVATSSVYSLEAGFLAENWGFYLCKLTPYSEWPCMASWLKFLYVQFGNQVARSLIIVRLEDKG